MLAGRKSLPHRCNLSYRPVSCSPTRFKIYLPSFSPLAVRTDSLFYELFHASPAIFFELIGRPDTEANGYEFRSVEVKQPDFRIDGVFIPSHNSASQRQPIELGN